MTSSKINMPEISVIICAYNHEKWIERCLRSLLHQSNIKPLDYEIILVDDCSNDNTKKILKNYKKFNNLKILFNKSNLGLPNSLNLAIQKSLGRYVVRVDSDDYVHRNFLFITKFFLDMNRNYQAVSVDYVKVDNDERLINTQINSSKKQIACGIMYRKECLIEIGLYNTKFKMREGHEINLRFKKKFKMARLELALYKYRIHDSNRTKEKNKLKKFDRMLKKKIK